MRTRFLQLAKSTGTPIFLVGHVTKDGSIAGPKVLEHMVDTVLYLEGERFNHYRLLRSTKNRFGPTHEVGVFEMQGGGLIEVANPSAVFLAERGTSAPGSVVTVAMEGTRPILEEIQALVSKSSLAMPRRTATGFDPSRLHLVTAVVNRRLGEAAKLGFVKALVPRSAGRHLPKEIGGIEVLPVATLRDAVHTLGL